MTSLFDVCRPGASGLPPSIGNTIVVAPSGQQPQNPVDGDLWFNTTNNTWNRWDAGSNTWITLAGGGGPGPGLPPATRQGQVLVAGPAATFTWGADDIDVGRI